MKKSIISFTVLLGLAGLGYLAYPKVLSYYTSLNSPVQKAEQNIQAMPVQVVSVAEKDFYPSLSFVAKIEAKDKVQVRARVTGFLTKRLFTEGDYVKEGQLLFEIEKDQFIASVHNAEANLSKAMANQENANAQFKRAQDLFKTKDLSQATLDQRQAEHSSARAAVKQAKAQLDIAKLNLNYTDVVAPLSGRIGSAAYSNGALIGPDSGALATIVSTTPMYAVFSVSENQLLQMKEFWKKDGQDDLLINFVFANGKPYEQEGSLNFIDIALDEQMNTMKLRISFPNPDNHLIAGQYGRIEMRITEPKQAILLPSDVILRDLAGSYVYIVNSNNMLEQRRIEKGLELASGETIIKNGLSVGEKVLASHLQMAPRLTKIPVLPSEKIITEMPKEE